MCMPIRPRPWAASVPCFDRWRVLQDPRSFPRDGVVQAGKLASIAGGDAVSDNSSEYGFVAVPAALSALKREAQ